MKWRSFAVHQKQVFPSVVNPWPDFLPLKATAGFISTWSNFHDELLKVGKRIPKLVFLLCIELRFGRSLDTTASRVFEIWFGHPFISLRAQAVLTTTCWCVQGHSVICIFQGCLLNSCFSKIRQTRTSLDFHQQPRVRVCRDTASCVCFTPVKTHMSKRPWKQLWQKSEQTKTNVSTLTQSYTGSTCKVSPQQSWQNKQIWSKIQTCHRHFYIIALLPIHQPMRFLEPGRVGSGRGYGIVKKLAADQFMCNLFRYFFPSSVCLLVSHPHWVKWRKSARRLVKI